MHDIIAEYVPDTIFLNKNGSRKSHENTTLEILHSAFLEEF
jgi:hypothetical protein